MPELPEVETIRRQLSRVLPGRALIRADFRVPGLLRSPAVARAKRRLAGRRIARVRRRGKHLLFDLSEGLTLVVHLGMTGGFRLLAPGACLPPHTRAWFELDGGGRLAFVDSRRFGRMRLAPTASLGELPELAALGPEPLSPAFTPERLAAALAGTRRCLKEVLLDQRRVAGIGNIYAAEILFRARLGPWRAAGALRHAEVARLREAMQEVLKEALRWRGTTIQAYADGRGERGLFQRRLRVYGREGEACPRCRRPVARRVRGGRSTYYCPRCQPHS